jgi:hypothetical protein
MGLPDLNSVGMERPVAKRLALAEFLFCEFGRLTFTRRIDLQGFLADLDLSAVSAEHVFHESNDKS